MEFRLILLDRDGVINRDSPRYIRGPQAFEPLPGSLEAIARLHRAGRLVAVCTNQSGVGRGYLSAETLAEIHQRMTNLIDAAGGHLDHIGVCPHVPGDGCGCRKPRPGLLLDAMSALGADAGHTLFIGDAPRDVEAARSAGCGAAIVRTGHGDETALAYPDVPAFADLGAAVGWVLQCANRTGSS